MSNTVFYDPSGRFSWRKALTALCAFLFAFAYIGHQLFAFKEIPSGYLVIIGLVFSFYFAKDASIIKKPIPEV